MSSGLLVFRNFDVASREKFADAKSRIASVHSYTQIYAGRLSLITPKLTAAVPSNHYNSIIRRKDVLKPGYVVDIVGVKVFTRSDTDKTTVALEVDPTNAAYNNEQKIFLGRIAKYNKMNGMTNEKPYPPCVVLANFNTPECAAEAEAILLADLPVSSLKLTDLVTLPKLHDAN